MFKFLDGVFSVIRWSVVEAYLALLLVVQFVTDTVPMTLPLGLMALAMVLSLQFSRHNNAYHDAYRGQLSMLVPTAAWVTNVVITVAALVALLLRVDDYTLSVFGLAVLSLFLATQVVRHTARGYRDREEKHLAGAAKVSA